MKFGIQYLYWRKDLGCKSYIPYLVEAKKVGFDILELGDYLILDMPEKEIDELAAAAKHNEMTLTVGLDPPPDCALTDDCKLVREKGIAFYGNAFKRLEKLGVSTLGGNMLNTPPRAPFGQYIQQEWVHGIESMHALGEIAAQYGITLCMEVMNRFEGHIFNTAKEGRRFADEVDLPNVKLLLDGFHMNIEESSFANAVLAAGEKLGHFHFIENHRGLPGTGHIPWQEVRDAMRQIGYDGAMVMEALVRAGGTLGDCVRIWRDVSGAGNEEELNHMAQSALHYSQYLFGQGFL